MKKLDVVHPSHCDQMFVITSFSRGPDRSGMGVNAYAELFSDREDGKPTHLHIYSLKTAVDAYQARKLKLPDSIVTVSYSNYCVRCKKHCVEVSHSLSLCEDCECIEPEPAFEPDVYSLELAFVD